MASAPTEAQLAAFEKLKRVFLLTQLIGFGLQFLVYGIYVCLFIVSLMIMYYRRRAAGSTLTSRVFLFATSTIFLLSTYGVAINFYRMVKGYVLSPDPWVYFAVEVSHWEHFCDYLNTCVVFIIGDSLVIYRAFIVWDRKLLVITLPLLLLAAQISVSIAIFIGYWNHSLFPWIIMGRLVNTVYPMAFAQNTITTGLISFRILRQHRLSTAAGIRDTGSSLFYISRIIVESAAVYTLGLFVMIVLIFVFSNGLWVVRFMQVPTVGIVFSLLAVRVHLSQIKDRAKPTVQTRSRALPTFAHWMATPLTETFDTVADTTIDTEGSSVPSSILATSTGGIGTGR